MNLYRLLEHPFDYARATFLVVAQAVRLWWLEPRLELDDLIARLARGRPIRVHPDRIASALERLLPWLPPWSCGPCVKRTYILYALWSRCGLNPSIRVEVRERENGFEGHLSLAPTGAAEDRPRSLRLG